jgi:hypothetical protein
MTTNKEKLALKDMSREDFEKLIEAIETDE